MADICYTAGVGRACFKHRVAVVAKTRDELSERLATYARGKLRWPFSGRSGARGRPPKVAFLFTGQGSQYVGMGRELYETQPTFRAAMDACDELLQPYLERSLVGMLYSAAGVEAGQERVLGQTRVTQPALFALGVRVGQLVAQLGGGAVGGDGSQRG